MAVRTREIFVRLGSNRLQFLRRPYMQSASSWNQDFMSNTTWETHTRCGACCSMMTISRLALKIDWVVPYAPNLHFVWICRVFWCHDHSGLVMSEEYRRFSFRQILLMENLCYWETSVASICDKLSCLWLCKATCQSSFAIIIQFLALEVNIPAFKKPVIVMLRNFIYIQRQQT